jgi:hydroxymethylpyrimidine/phosphomethylpyrimidine kinase / thiaminase
LLGYYIIAKRLHSDSKTKRDGNPYWKWIEAYVADEYLDAVRVGSGENEKPTPMPAKFNKCKELIEKSATLQSPSRIGELVKIFIYATKLETCFWSMGIGPSRSGGS